MATGSSPYTYEVYFDGMPLGETFDAGFGIRQTRRRRLLNAIEAFIDKRQWWVNRLERW